MQGNEKITCKYCSGICVRAGCHKNGKQRFKCKLCRKRQQEYYLYKAYNNINSYIIAYHKTSLYGTNHIERNNLTIRTHIKRLTRRTICFSRNVDMLYATLKIYFWAE